MNAPIRSILWPGKWDTERFLREEWLVTNGLGGYASGTISGVATRRFHGLLIAALPAPFGRTMMLNHLIERLRLPDGSYIQLCGEETGPDSVETHCSNNLSEFRLEKGLPVWVFDFGDAKVEKRLLTPHLQNTVHITYRLISGSGPAQIELRPAMHFRPHEGRVSEPAPEPYTLMIIEDRYEVIGNPDHPRLRMRLLGENASLTLDRGVIKDLFYRVEARRGYDSQGVLWSPGYFSVTLAPDREATLIASTEPWSTIYAIEPRDALLAETERRERLLSMAMAPAQTGFGAEMALASDQFIIIPAGRVEESARARAAGDEVRTVIARRALRRSRVDTADLRSLRARGIDPQPVPRRGKGRAVSYGRRDALVLPRARSIPSGDRRPRYVAADPTHIARNRHVSHPGHAVRDRRRSA
jgi:predicted glycogen debranching enzyme